MTDNNHPITPSIELVKQWSDHWHSANDNDFDHALFISIQAARWGADMELEACCEWLEDFNCSKRFTAELRAARRPKPPSLKELAMKALDEAVYMADDIPPEGISTDQADIIRRALESLPD
jgi:hypothetical protein